MITRLFTQTLKRWSSFVKTVHIGFGESDRLCCQSWALSQSRPDSSLILSVGVVIWQYTASPAPWSIVFQDLRILLSLLVGSETPITRDSVWKKYIDDLLCSVLIYVSTFIPR